MERGCVMVGMLFRVMRVVFRGLASALGNPATSGLVALTGTIVLAAATFYWFVEGWSFLDAMFFSVATISTVGYGDMVPGTAAGRIFTMIYIFVGIGVFVATAASIAEHVFSNGRAARQHPGRRIEE
jgi:voltage-gated potassium channel Kch